MKKIAFISTDWNDNEYRKSNNAYGGVTYYRLVKPMELLKEKYDVTFCGAEIQKRSEGKSTDEFYDEITKEFDMIVVKQIDNATASQALIHWCMVNNCILVQDYDDNMMAIREDQPAFHMGYQEGGQRRAYAAAMMSLADALIVSTEPLKKAFTRFLRLVFNEKTDTYVFPNYNDVEDWAYVPGIRDTNKIVIGWAGSVTHDSDLRLVLPTIGKLLDNYDNVYLELLGGIMQGSLATLTKGFTDKAKDKVKVIYGTPAWDKYPSLMRAQAWDIGIAPLIDDEFNQSKSHIKWMEYTMCGIPTIASKVAPYSDNIEHGKTGYLAKTTKDWKKYLVELIENPEKRKELLTNAVDEVLDNRQYRQHQEEYVKIIDTIFEKGKKTS